MKKFGYSIKSKNIINNKIFKITSAVIPTIYTSLHYQQINEQLPTLIDQMKNQDMAIYLQGNGDFHRSNKQNDNEEIIYNDTNDNIHE